MPSLLSRWVWPPLAFGLAGFAVALSTRWLPALYPEWERQGPRDAATMALVVGIVAGAASYLLH